MVFLELVSKAALRGTADAPTARARPGWEVRVGPTHRQLPSVECRPVGHPVPLKLTAPVPPKLYTV